MNFLLIENIDKDKFKVEIDNHLKIEPIKILIPDAYVLPESIILNEKVLRKINELKNLEIIERDDITFIPGEL